MLPERYRTEIRTGRDQDVEEYLAADEILDRPVLVRQLDPTATATRRHGFLRNVRAAAAISHTHLLDVYAADMDNDVAYAVLEWAGGMTLADRVAAGLPMSRDDFLPNAAGLAEALAELHERGQVHGNIDATAIFYTTGHPAKLGAFGRPPLISEPPGDVRALAEALHLASGEPGTWDDEIGPHIGTILDSAQQGDLSAADLADALHAAPGPAPQAASTSAWTWRWVGPGAVLLALAIAAAILALITTAGDSDPFGLPSVSTSPAPSVTISTTTTEPVGATLAPIAINEISVYDPLGDDSEFDQRLPSLTDGDPETSWRTERYFDPLSAVKAGVGIVFRLDSSPGAVSILGSESTIVEVRWTPTAIVPGSPSDWETLAASTLGGAETVIELPTRSDGLWLLWITDVAVQDDGEFHYSFLAELRFLA